MKLLVTPIVLFSALLIATAQDTRAATPPKPGRTLTVGEGRMYALPSQAAKAALDGDTVVIDPGMYANDTAVWRANNLTIRPVGDIPVRLDPKGTSAEGKAIWVVKGNNVAITGVEFANCTVGDKNGAGIRAEGAGLTVTDCSFHDNQEGILAGNNPDSDITVAHSRFVHNGAGDGYSHNIYINHVRSLTITNCEFRDAVVGHDIKSRAAKTIIQNCTIADADNSITSYLIDLPNGGEAFILGNILERCPTAEQATLISYGEEGASNLTQALYIVNNTFSNRRMEATFVRVNGLPTLRVINNLFLGPGTRMAGMVGGIANNRDAAKTDFRLADGHDFHLASDSKAIGAGIDPGFADGVDLLSPDLRLHVKWHKGRIDLGAVSYAAPAAPNQ